MHSSSDVKEGLAEFFIHLCHRAALAAIIKLHCACKQEKRKPTHSRYLGIDDFGVHGIDICEY